MIKSLIQKLFIRNKKKDELIKGLKNISGFKTMDETELEGNSQRKPKKFILEKGKVLPIFLPEFEGFSNLKITKWHFQAGDLIEEGSIICEIENETITLEFESFANGRISDICPLNKILKTGEKLCELEGV
ncbi:hypothetical protein GCM10022393_37940 [Aquimarina addita]|uniref:Lipoyl-binding domain-containing protein n=1 Tax=Aquimarina addita TaxID=870485 RepID=A0ABP6UVZ8_9FLAO